MFDNPLPEIQAFADMLQARADALQKLQDGGHKSLLEFARDQVDKTVERSFNDEVTPDNVGWAPLKYRKRTRTTPILTLSGTMRRDTEAAVKGATIGHDEMTITVQTPYAPVHQFGRPPNDGSPGSGIVPKREFLGFSDESIDAIYAEAERQIHEAFGEKTP